MTQPAPGPSDPAVPDGDYLPPEGAYREAAPRLTAADDPLVNPPEQYIAGWAHRTGMLLRRSARPLAVIFVLTHTLPALAFTLLLRGIAPELRELDLRLFSGRGERLLGALLVAGLAYAVAVLLPQLLGYAAATHHATRQAAGLTVSIGQSLRFGLRRLLGLAAYQLVAYVLVGVAVAAVAMCCVGAADYLGLVPTALVYVYLAMATALVGPAYLFERRNAIADSFRLFHAALWPNAARLLLVGLTVLASSFAEVMVGAIGDRAGAALGVTATVPLIPVTGAVLTAAVEVPLTMLLFSGVLITYAERLGAERGIGTADLAGRLR
ncbi:hypothetical protein CS0771_09520 [Catellatospora sp. IY07-71]|uniref:hypothetical protein n=1 Tax=Catellatospora sp. IY07-71 TaxID=2728827 RepID=UPI001BB3DACE|nr:hypothetical protein [Catellatospora sp. IY07-71]BCJ71408.1 hypothetical protein CS0771_09520 [Catellatospora sp. IY07-71]